jgi:hypothetical protein
MTMCVCWLAARECRDMRACGGGDLHGLYSALSHVSKLVVYWYPSSGVGAVLGKVVGVISCPVGPVRGYCRTGPQCPLAQCPLVSASSIYAAIVYVPGGWCNDPVLSGVLCEFKYAASNSLSPSLPSRRTWALGSCLRTTWPDDSWLSPVQLVI